MQVSEIKELPIKSWKQDPTELIEAIKQSTFKPPIVKCILGPGVIDQIEKETGTPICYMPENCNSLRAWTFTDLDFLHEYVRTKTIKILSEYKFLKDGVVTLEQDRNFEICLQLLAGHYRDHALYGVLFFDLYCLYRRLSGIKK